MATARSDPLRSTLDNLQLDPSSAADRPYLVAMLRRLGYTEREIDEVVRTGKMPTTAPADDGLAPSRDYKLVVPASDTRFALDNTGAVAGADSPFEDLERLEFEDPSTFEEFQPVTEGEGAAGEVADADAEADEAARRGQPLEWQDTQEAAGGAPDERLEEQAEGAAGEGGPGFEGAPIDTFGSADAAAGAAGHKTRVRVRRVRAASREEAERKVAGRDRNVIKSIPVDIVERWGPGQGPKKDEPKKEG